MRKIKKEKVKEKCRFLKLTLLIDEKGKVKDDKPTG